MNKGLIFFCCACGILLLTIINLSIGPIVSGAAKRYVGRDWGTLNCKEPKDAYDEAKKDDDIDDDTLKYHYKWNVDQCIRLKGMHNMEYTSFIFDIVIGFVCGLLGLLHLFEVKKDLVSKTGLIGLGCGIVGFVLTFVYVIFNGLVYTAPITGIPKRDGDYAFAKKEGNNFKCLYFDNEHNEHSIYASIADLIQKQYNYKKEWDKKIEANCKSDDYRLCALKETYASDGSDGAFFGKSNCNKLYIATGTSEITNKDISDRFLAALILSLIVCLANIGLAVFGFLIFSSGEF